MRAKFGFLDLDSLNIPGSRNSTYQFKLFKLIFTKTGGETNVSEFIEFSLPGIKKVANNCLLYHYYYFYDKDKKSTAEYIRVIFS